MRIDKQKAYVLGKWAEIWCRFYLRIKGYRIVEWNVNSAGVEIDIIARQQSSLIFVEVKYRTRLDLVTALHSITIRKQKRLLRGALMYQSLKPEYAMLTTRFDVIIIMGSIWAWPFRTYHIQNAYCDG